MRRAYLTIGRDVFHKHIDQFTDDEFRYAREFIALRLLEQDDERG